MAVGSNTDTAPQMLAHYADLKVDSLLVNIHLEHYDDPLLHNGEIDVADPQFYFADSTTEYPLWNEVRAKILSLARAHGL